MKNNINCGVWPTMITAYKQDGSLDLRANREIARRLVAMGSDGIFAVCQSSEMFFLSLEEKIQLAEIVCEEAAGKASVVVSGHTADCLEEQIHQMRELAAVGADALVLVTNRLAGNEDGEDVFRKNTGAILDVIPNVDFGFYECPYPFKRLLSDSEITWSAETGRVRFLKDVSCNKEIETRRAEQVSGSSLQLYNANTQTLLHSLKAGYAGYNGVMGNFHIDIYRWLFQNISDPRAERVQEWLSRQAEIEVPAYPMVAKYYLQLKGLDITTVTRSKSVDLLDEAQKQRVRKLIEEETQLREELGLPAQN